jgi:15-hydroxyprostaglandin dehydrogenase (NAD)
MRSSYRIPDFSLLTFCFQYLYILYCTLFEMSKPVAIITGAASGIGLALTRRLLEKQWRIVMADINVDKGRDLETELGPDVLFIETDVSSCDSQVRLFENAYEWAGHRLDFLASNAGVADMRNLVEGLEEEDGALKKPFCSKTIKVNLFGSVYAIQLFAHYVKKSGRTGGKVVVTSSGAASMGCQVILCTVLRNMG